MTKTKFLALLIAAIFALPIANAMAAHPVAEEKSVLGGDPCEFVPVPKESNPIARTEPQEYLQKLDKIYIYATAFSRTEKMDGKDVAKIAVCSLKRYLDASSIIHRVPVEVLPIDFTTSSLKEAASSVKDNELLIYISFGQRQSKIYDSSFDDVYVMQWNYYRPDINPVDRLYGERAQAFSKDKNGKGLKELLTQAIRLSLPLADLIRLNAKK